MTTIQLLQASVDAETASEFRLLIDNKFVKYITIDGGLYSPDDMCFGPSLISLLPPLPAGHWNEGRISLNPTTGAAHFATVLKTRLPGITQIWHSTQIDHLELHMGRKLRTNVYEATHPRFNSTIIVKFARFPWEVPQLEKETVAYEWIDGHKIGPAFLGRLAEEGSVIGFVIERIADFRHATLDDLDLCRLGLTKLHTLGIKHGDINKHNFLVHDGNITLIDFEVASQTVDPDELERELVDLPSQLRDTSGRGGRVVENGPS
ncbi:alpha-galactosidase A precursor [Xylaria cf. heliscus]|nr:alpha-galactosidase A precursor [Xylaria cf. heliscus]